MLQIEAASLLQIVASVPTDWGSYYKLGQNLLQIRAIIMNWGIIGCNERGRLKCKHNIFLQFIPSSRSKQHGECKREQTAELM